MTKRLIKFALLAAALAGIAGCSNQSQKAKDAVEQYLKNQGVQDLKIDLFCTNPSLPEKAYVSVTVTYNFANAAGQPQKEYLGYILKQEGREWRVEQSASYTKEEERARTLLAGKKM